MSGDYTQFEQRKKDHITLALNDDNQAKEANRFDSISLVHDALPDLDFNDISIVSTRFSKPVDKPFMISSMTAGHADAEALNRTFVGACHEMGWAMGVGSQRRELTDETASDVWRDLRRQYPDVSLYSNLGIAQLITTPHVKIQKMIDALGAEACIIHCNALQECIQPEGTPEFKGGLQALEQLVKASSVPIIVKETGCGFSKPTLRRLNGIGVQAVDVSGLGGTHWGRIEGGRANQPMLERVADTFRNWGVSTLMSARYATEISPQFEVWGSGGVRHGLDAAKLFALGATTVGFAKPMLQAALQSDADLIQIMQTIEYELRVALFCTGSQNLQALKEKISW